MKRKILYLSMCAPFSNARHAGGKTFNYYIDSFANESENEVTLITKILDDEIGNEDKINDKIKKYCVYKEKGVRKYLSYAISFNSKYNPFYKYGNVLLKSTYIQYENILKELYKEGYKPDVVLLEWTSMLLFIDVVKKYFPDSVYVASEHDVSFLGAYRKYQTEKRKIFRKYKKAKYKNIKKRELDSISKCDYVVAHNIKDQNLLKMNGVSIEKAGFIVPYYDRFDIERKNINNDIIFYGAMNRVENSESALWFIDNVMPLIQDLPIRFVVVGNKPPESLKSKSSEKIVVTGFVEDVSPYFESSMCLVAPLLHGAGVKVKIIEALSAGIPVLTNEIGIEGIPAMDKKEFFMCQTPEQYADRIREMIDNYSEYCLVAKNSTEMIEQAFNLETSFKNYSSIIYELIENKK